MGGRGERGSTQRRVRAPWEDAAGRSQGRPRHTKSGGEALTWHSSAGACLAAGPWQRRPMVMAGCPARALLQCWLPCLTTRLPQRLAGAIRTGAMDGRNARRCPSGRRHARDVRGRSTNGGVGVHQCRDRVASRRAAEGTDRVRDGESGAKVHGGSAPLAATPPPASKGGGGAVEGGGGRAGQRRAAVVDAGAAEAEALVQAAVVVAGAAVAPLGAAGARLRAHAVAQAAAAAQQGRGVHHWRHRRHCQLPQGNASAAGEAAGRRGRAGDGSRRGGGRRAPRRRPAWRRPAWWQRRRRPAQRRGRRPAWRRRLAGASTGRRRAATGRRWRPPGRRARERGRRRPPGRRPWWRRLGPRGRRLGGIRVLLLPHYAQHSEG